MRAHRIRTNVHAALAVVIGGAHLTPVCLHKDSWPEVQQTRINAIEAYNKLINPNHRLRLTALKEVAILSFMSLLPPDRVGVVRAARLTLVLIPMRRAITSPLPHCPCRCVGCASSTRSSSALEAGTASTSRLARMATRHPSITARTSAVQQYRPFERLASVLIVRSLSVLLCLSVACCRSVLHGSAGCAHRAARSPRIGAPARGRGRRRSILVRSKPRHRPTVRVAGVDYGREEGLRQALWSRDRTKDSANAMAHNILTTP